MKWGYRFALGALVLGLLPLAASLLADRRLTGALLLPPITLPMGVLLLMRTRLASRIRMPALAGGGLVAPLIALASQPLVFGFAYAFFLGFGDSGRKLLEALRVDPKLTTALASPWLVFVLIEVAAVVPFVEEFAKALGASWARPGSRREAFFAGVTAGCAFAAIENILYVGAAAALGRPWEAMVAVRALGVAVHPLATGLTMLGYWEAHERGSSGALARGYFSAAGVHMLWNGSTIVAFVATTAMSTGGLPGQHGAVALSFAAVLGVALAGALWQVTQSVVDGEGSVLRWRLNGAEPLAAWTLIAAALLVPVSILLLAFPRFYRG